MSSPAYVVSLVTYLSIFALLRVPPKLAHVAVTEVSVLGCRGVAAVTFFLQLYKKQNDILF